MTELSTGLVLFWVYFCFEWLLDPARFYVTPWWHITRNCLWIALYCRATFASFGRVQNQLIFVRNKQNCIKAFPGSRWRRDVASRTWHCSIVYPALHKHQSLARLWYICVSWGHIKINNLVLFNLELLHMTLLITQLSLGISCGIQIDFIH